MTYFHTVAIFAGSQDPVKVTSYTEAEQKAYEASLPTDAKILYSGVRAGEMKRAFSAARRAFKPTEKLIANRIRDERVLRSEQRGVDYNQIHTSEEIDRIVAAAYWD